MEANSRNFIEKTVTENEFSAERNHEDVILTRVKFKSKFSTNSRFYFEILFTTIHDNGRRAKHEEEDTRWS